MVLSYYILKLPYTIIFNLLTLLKLNNYFAAYIGDELDYYIMEPVLRFIPELKLISKNKRIQHYLADKGLISTLLPAFPKGVLMCRLAAHKFPATKMVKIGMRHGPYHFKSLSNKRNYLLFDQFIFTSEHEARIAQESEIINGIGIGYPKLDKAFNGEIDQNMINELKVQMGFDNSKKTLLFTSTWEGSGMSAIDKWYNKLYLLAEDYNILVSLHPWTSKKYRYEIEKSRNITLIRGYDTTPYIMIADICIGDTSSILGDCCALDKPIITFEVDTAHRTTPEITELIKSFSISIKDFDELIPAIKQYENTPDLKKGERKKANDIMFSNLDGSASKKAAEFIRKEFNI